MAFRTQTGETNLLDSTLADGPTTAPAHDRSGAGRPGHDPLLLAKLQDLMRRHNLSDERACHEAAGRLSVRRFLGLTADDLVPDPGTFARFRERRGRVSRPGEPEALRSARGGGVGVEHQVHRIGAQGAKRQGQVGDGRGWGGG